MITRKPKARVVQLGTVDDLPVVAQIVQWYDYRGWEVRVGGSLIGYVAQAANREWVTIEEPAFYARAGRRHETGRYPTRAVAVAALAEAKGLI